MIMGKTEKRIVNEKRNLMSKIKIARGDVGWSYAGNILKIVSNIILLPLVLKLLTDQEMGLWYVFLSIGGIVELLDFGFAATLARNMAYVWCGATELMAKDVKPSSVRSEPDMKLFLVILKTCKRIYAVIALAALVILATVGTLYLNYVSNGLTTSLLVAWGIYSIGVTLSIFYSYYTSFLRGVGAIAQQNKATVISRMSQIVVALILLLCGMGLIAVAVGYLVSGIVLRLMSRWFFYRYENIGESLKEVGKIENINEQVIATFRKVWPNSYKEGFVTLANFLSTQANTLICSFALGLASTGSYGLALQLSTMISSIAAILYTAYQPAIQEFEVKGERKESQRLMSMAYCFYMLSYIVLTIGAFCCLPIIKYLKPTLEIDGAMLIVLCLYMFIYKTYHLAASYISNRNKLPYVTSFIISGVCSSLLAFILAKLTTLGIWSIIIGPMTVVLSFVGWYWPRYVLKDMNLSVSKMMKLGFGEIKKVVGDLLGLRKG